MTRQDYRAGEAQAQACDIALTRWSPHCPPYVEHRDGFEAGFDAGAVWQREQYDKYPYNRTQSLEKERDEQAALLRRCAVALHNAQADGCWRCGGGVAPYDGGCDVAALITELHALGLWHEQQPDQRQTSFLDAAEEKQ